MGLKDKGGLRGVWFSIMDRTPGWLRAAFFIAGTLAFWFGIAKAATFALRHIPVSFGGGGGAVDVTMGMTWLWNLLFLSIAVWIAALAVWPAPPDPDFTANPPDEKHLVRLQAFTVDAETAMANMREEFRTQVQRLEVLVSKAADVEQDLRSRIDQAASVVGAANKTETVVSTANVSNERVRPDVVTDS